MLSVTAEYYGIIYQLCKLKDSTALFSSSVEIGVAVRSPSAVDVLIGSCSTSQEENECFSIVSSYVSNNEFLGKYNIGVGIGILPGLTTEQKSKYAKTVLSLSVIKYDTENKLVIVVDGFEYLHKIELV